MKKKSLISIFAVLFAAVFALTCAFFAACSGGGEDKKQEDAGVEQTEPEDGSGEIGDGESSGGTSETPGESEGSDSGDGESSGDTSETPGDTEGSGSGDASGTHIHQYTATDVVWGTDHSSYSATLVCTKDGCTWTDNKLSVYTTATAEVVRPSTCSEVGSIKYSSAEIALDDGTTYTAVQTERTAIVGCDVVKIEGREPTCTETGLSAYWQCTMCKTMWVYAESQAGVAEVGEEITDEDTLVIPSLGHTYTTVTENENGLWHTGRCERCGADLDEWHTYGEDDKCTAQGCTAEFKNESEIEFTENTDGTYNVSTANAEAKNLDGVKTVIPATYKGKPVTTISSTASMQLITDLVIGPNITSSLADRMFNYNNSGCKNYLKKLTLTGPAGVGGNVFTNYTVLEEVEFWSGTTSIGNTTFQGCTNLKKITIPEECTTISYNAFQNCSSLEEVVMNDKLENIQYNAFAGCYSLKEFLVPASVKTLGYTVFGNATYQDNQGEVLYLDRTKEDVDADVGYGGWTTSSRPNHSWDSYFNGTVYFYSEEDPLVYIGTKADGSSQYTYGFWHYNSEGEKEIWQAT